MAKSIRYAGIRGNRMRVQNMELVRRQEIRRFLMARRAAIAPDAVGLPGGVRRRTPGLRREEVASLAGIGVTWYTWFEQGRDIQVSAHSLERIARALRLSASDTEYLFALSRVPRVESTRIEGRVPKCIETALDGYQAGPAMYATPYWDMLAYNRLADMVFKFDDYSGPYARNHTWRFFMDPKRRAIYVDPEALGAISVLALRTAHGKFPDDPYFNGMIRELCEGSAEFKRLWDAQLTASPLGALTLGITVPPYGPLQFTSMRFRSFDSDNVLLLLSPTDEKAARAMRELANSSSR